MRTKWEKFYMDNSTSIAPIEHLKQSTNVPMNNNNMMDFGGSTAKATTTSSNNSQHFHQNSLSRVKSLDTCRVCGDGPARMHYGVPTCFGCKGFFRRTLKRTKEYTCRYSGNCIVDRYERNSCRFCRFKRCLKVGMDPKAVRPDRDAAGRTHPIRRRISRNHLIGVPNGNLGELGGAETELMEANGTDEWVRKLPVEMRTLLMQIMNMEAMVHHGDTHELAKNLYPPSFHSLRQMFEDPSCLDGKRTEIRYEPYRQVEPEELTFLAHRRLIATVDIIDHLCALMDLPNTRDKLILTKAAYAPVTIFCAVAATARMTRNRDILCLCNYGYVPRGAHLSYAEPYHFANRLVDRALDELVEPFRTFNFKEQEIVLMKAIVALNPYLPSLSTEAAEQVADFRDRIQETLYNVVRESHPKEVASSRFGNLLLFLPNIMILGSIMMENLQFIQSFRHKEIGPLLSELLEDIDEQQVAENGTADALSMTSNESDQSMRHSQSASSFCSSGIGASQSCNNLAAFSQYQQQLSSPNLSGSEPDLNVQKRGSTGKLLHSQMSSNDSDPDYNVTLTAESLRQTMQHQMEVDSPPIDQNAGQQSALIFTPPILLPNQKPQFFIDPSTNNFIVNQPPPQAECQKQQQIKAARHIFTVEKSPMLMPPCCRQCSILEPGKCKNNECPTALAAIFHQQQQRQHSLFHQQFEENAIENGEEGIFFVGGNQQQTMSKSQSFPPFGSADAKNFGMPYSASHDNFQQK